MLFVSFLSAASIILFSRHFKMSLLKTDPRRKVIYSNYLSHFQQTQCRRTLPVLSISVSKRLVLTCTDCHEYLRIVEGQRKPTSFFGSASCWWWKKKLWHFLCMCNLALQAAFRAFALLEWCNTFLTWKSGLFWTTSHTILVNLY